MSRYINSLSARNRTISRYIVDVKAIKILNTNVRFYVLKRGASQKSIARLIS